FMFGLCRLRQCGRICLSLHQRGLLLAQQCDQLLQSGVLTAQYFSKLSVHVQSSSSMLRTLSISPCEMRSVRISRRPSRMASLISLTRALSISWLPEVCCSWAVDPSCDGFFACAVLS